ncbi:MAG: polysaccharide deacetylase family protein [Bacteroidetes bacterium]|nr:polysaccharide deacetylase family protein [Bacteroidota bacterium]
MKELFLSKLKPAALIRNSSLLFLLFFIACNDHTHSKETKQATADLKKNQTSAADSTVVPDTTPIQKKKRIYLTFDDGPSPDAGTKNVLHILKEENVPATFFIIGEHITGSPGQKIEWDALRNDNAVEICNHSFSHAWHNKFQKFYNHPDSVVKDFQKTEAVLGLSNNIVRAPGRNSWRTGTVTYTDEKKSKAAIDSLKKAGFIVMGWDIEWRFDYKTQKIIQSADLMAKQIDDFFKEKENKTPDNLVLLAHDRIYKDTADSTALHQLIKLLKQKNEYNFALISNYPNLRSAPVDSLKTKVTLPKK